MKPGLYRLSFRLDAQAVGGGVVFLKDGKLLGGDSGSAYVGTYEESGDAFNAQVKISNYPADAPGMQFVFGASGGNVNLSGTSSDTEIHAAGTSPQLPGTTFDCRLHWVAE